jgi:class 3 adenylate cyclase
MDFVQRIISFDEESGTAEVVLEPDPRRYEWKEIGGERYLHDKLDDLYFSKQAYTQAFEQLVGQPIYLERQKIDDAEAYIKSRRVLVASMLDGFEHPPTFEDRSEEFLQSLAVDKLAFVVISLDIVGSTILATATDPKTYARLISTVLYELSEVVPKFHGHVLKYTGDGLIAYFPEPSFIRKNDLALDCALTLRGLVYRALNPILQEHGFPSIGVRIGLDAGEAYIETIGSPETKQHKDIIGAVVSLAAKIQARAKPGEIYLGATVERNLHTMWRQVCEPANLGSDWSYRDLTGNVYKAYRVKTGQ